MFSGVKDYFGNLSSKGIAAWVGGTVTAISATVGVAFLYKSGKWPFNKKAVKVNEKPDEIDTGEKKDENDQ